MILYLKISKFNAKYKLKFYNTGFCVLKLKIGCKYPYKLYYSHNELHS